MCYAWALLLLKRRTSPGTPRLSSASVQGTSCGPHSEISNSDESFHFVLVSRRELHGKICCIGGFNTDHLNLALLRLLQIRVGLIEIMNRVQCPHSRLFDIRNSMVLYAEVPQSAGKLSYYSLPTSSRPRSEPKVARWTGRKSACNHLFVPSSLSVNMLTVTAPPT